MKDLTTYDTFDALDIRVGTVMDVEVLQHAKKPAYVLHINFGSDIGTLKSSAQITELYNAQELIHKQVIAVVNFPVKQIAQIQSQCLVLGLQTKFGVVLLQPERGINNGLAVS